MVAEPRQRRAMEIDKFWVVTVSADHAARGREAGIVQACHGKAAPLRRMKPGDGVVIYSPRDAFKDGAPLMAFTAIGRINAQDPFPFDMGGGLIPWRRGVDWQPNTVAMPIRPVLDQLDLTRRQKSWGMVFRLGLAPMTRSDFALIARQMVSPGQAIPF